MDLILSQLIPEHNIKTLLRLADSTDLRQEFKFYKKFY